MKKASGIGLEEVQAVYSGPEGDLWELVMGEQIHIGGFTSSMDLAERAGIAAGARGVDLCCCNGAGMRFLLRFRGAAHMTGVDATEHVVERGRRRCQAEGLAEQTTFVLADACRTGLPDGGMDFVWGEDAWCYVEGKDALIAEAARLLRPGGTIAFTDWVEGPSGLSDAEAARLLTFMKFPNVYRLQDYRDALDRHGLSVREADVTGRFAPHCDLYLDMLGKQLTFDALKLIGFDQEVMDGLAGEMVFLRNLARAGKVAQARVIGSKAR